MVSKDHIRELNKIASKNYRERHPEKRKAICKSYRDRNRDKLREYNRKWELENHEHVLNRRRLLRQKHSKQYREADKKLRKSKLHIYRENVRRRRAMIANCTTENCSSAVKQLLRAHRCYWCWTEFDLISRPEIEHIVPLNRGGKHSPDNLVAACRRCNSSKSDRLYWEWDGELAS